MYKWVFSERLKVSGDEHRRIASGRVQVGEQRRDMVLNHAARAARK